MWCGLICRGFVVEKLTVVCCGVPSVGRKNHFAELRISCCARTTKPSFSLLTAAINSEPFYLPTSQAYERNSLGSNENYGLTILGKSTGEDLGLSL